MLAIPQVTGCLSSIRTGAMKALGRLILTMLVLLSVAESRAQGLCSVCNRYLEGGEASARAVDQMTLKERVVCSRCTAIPELCFLCVIPAKDGRKSLSDGRHYCARDAQVAVFGSLEVERICRETVARMERPFARFLTLPSSGVSWAVEDSTLRARGNETEPKRCAHPAYSHHVKRVATRTDPIGSGARPHARVARGERGSRTTDATGDSRVLLRNDGLAGNESVWRGGSG
jgi:hypothetical protein